MIREKSKAGKYGERLLNLLYPRRCPACHRILRDPNGLICPECGKKQKPISEPRCKKCGKSIESEEAEFCLDCQRQKHEFDEGRGIFSYDAKMKASILRYKDGGRREYGDFYVQAMLHYGKRELKRWQPQAVLAVPVHPRKQRMRGFNQAEYLAEKIAAQLQIPYLKNYMKKTVLTKPQKNLGAAQRRKNLRHSFEGLGGDWGIRRLLIIDDVYTTGSTLDAVSFQARRHGVEKIFFLTVCVGKGN